MCSAGKLGHWFLDRIGALRVTKVFGGAGSAETLVTIPLVEAATFGELMQRGYDDAIRNLPVLLDGEPNGGYVQTEPGSTWDWGEDEMFQYTN